MNPKLTKTNYKDIYVTDYGVVYYKEYIPLPQRKMKAWKDGSDYLVVDIPKGNKTKHIHRLMCETFHPMTPEDIKLGRTLVNHKDGDKYNNHKDNLEWVSYSENLEHAFKAGLRTDNKVTHVIDLKTGEESEYHSQAEVARQLNTNAPKLCSYFKTKRLQPFLGRYSVWRSNEPKPTFTKDDIVEIVNGAAKPVIMFNKKTGNVIQTGSRGKAAEIAKMEPSTVGFYLHNRNVKNKQMVGKGDWEFWYLSDYQGEVGEPGLVVGSLSVDKTENLRTKTRAIPVEITNIIDETTTRYENIADFIAEHDLPNAFTRKCAHLGFVLRNTWKIKYIR